MLIRSVSLLSPTSSTSFPLEPSSLTSPLVYSLLLRCVVVRRRDAAESLLLLQLSALDAEAKDMSGRYGLPAPDLTLSLSGDDDDDEYDGEAGADGDGGGEGGGGGGGGGDGEGGSASHDTPEHEAELRSIDKEEAAGPEVNRSMVLVS